MDLSISVSSDSGKVPFQRTLVPSVIDCQPKNSNTLTEHYPDSVFYVLRRARRKTPTIPSSATIKRAKAQSQTRVTAILNRNTHDISTDLMLRVFGLARGASETPIQERCLNQRGFEALSRKSPSLLPSAYCSCLLLLPPAS
jgi:hypothetical protein